ncbi:MAG: ATP-dependent helicase [Patescibacteria group bacterium]
MNKLDLSKLTDEQRVAATHIGGPAYVSAGPGSGKTRSLTIRIVWLIEQGVDPSTIVAMTFTNKAANEMKTRVKEMLGNSNVKIQISTMHSFCVGVIRHFWQYCGLKNPDFSICDEDDTKRYTIQAIATVKGKDIKQVKEDDSKYGPDHCRWAISREKNQLIRPEDMDPEAGQDREHTKFIIRVYKEYQNILFKANSMDFDDLIMKAVFCLNDADRQQQVAGRIQHLLVDEYQDTNISQIRLIQQLSSVHRNVWAVGDKNQSVYAFRFADQTCENKFFEYFPDAKVYTLQYNFRSVPPITEVANRVIANNPQLVDKKIIPKREGGEKPQCVGCSNPETEARFIVDDIQRLVRMGKGSWRDCAVLYRTRYQSRALEEAAVKDSIPYRVVGALGFYQRSIIKDVLAYLKLLVNPDDNASFTRIHNTPKRGIGEVGMQQFCRCADELDLPLFRIMRKGAFMDKLNEPGRGGFRELNRIFVELLKLPQNQASLVISAIIEATHYKFFLEQKGTEAAFDQIDLLDELVTAADTFDQQNGGGVSGFLEHVMLMQQRERKEDENVVLFMTVHAAKGLEFPRVWIAGVCDGLMPILPRNDDRTVWTPATLAAHFEEERRIFYVAATRAKDKLTMTWPLSRRTKNGMMDVSISPFCMEARDALYHCGENGEWDDLNAVFEEKPEQQEKAKIAAIRRRRANMPVDPPAWQKNQYGRNRYMIGGRKK